MTGDGAVVRCKFCGLGPPELRREFQCEVQSVADLEQSCPHYWKAHARQQAAEIERLTRERDEFAFDRQQLWAAKAASEARTADLLKALEGLLSPDKMSVYGTMDKIAAAWAAIAAAKGGTV